jgi:hypothetical protein
MANVQSAFPIPASLQDLEREPYNLLPYPQDFNDDDEASRADSFNTLVDLVERGNRTLMNGGLSLFETYEEQGPWMDGDRVQAMYTLVRLVVYCDRCLVVCFALSHFNLFNRISTTENPHP